MCTCMRPMLRHYDRQIPLPASAPTHAHATTASTRPASVTADSTAHDSWNGRATETRGTHTSPIIRFTQRVLRGYSAGTHRVLSGFSVEGVGAPVGDAGDGCVVGISVNVFPCTSIERNTDTVTRAGVRTARGALRGSTARRRGGGRRAAWGQSGRSCNRHATVYAARTPRFPMRCYASIP